MPKTIEVTSGKAESVSLAGAGQIPCVLVYSDPKHAAYIQQIINYVEEVLRGLGFVVNKLCDSTPPDEHFGENFEKLVEKCIVGVVILDGFRPNVLFEYGYLRGKDKVILPIQHCNACIAVKSLYSLTDQASDKDIQSNTNLTKAQFNKLKEPSIGYFRQLSDCHGINVIEVDCNTELASDKHPKRRIEAEVKKLMPKILALYTEQSLKTVKQVTPEHFQKFQNVTLRVLQYFTKASPFKRRDVEKAMEEIAELERDSGITLPSAVYGIISSLYETLAERYLMSDTDKTAEFYKAAIRMYERILEIEKDASLRANTFFNKGIAHFDLAGVRDTESNLEKAIKAYQEALTIITKKDYPINYAATQSNLGVAYGDLAGVRDKEPNLEKSIKAYQEALTIYTKKDYPINYAMTQNNLGNAYEILAGVRDKEPNLEKSIKAYQEALTIYTKKDYPINYAMTQNNLGNAYDDLAGVRDKGPNLEKAIKAFEEALTIRTKKGHPIKYAMTQNNLGNAYEILAGVRDKEPNLEKSIKAYQEALTIITKKDYPIKYAMTQNNLGVTYRNLAGVRDKEPNLEKAIKAYQEALTIYTKKDYPINYAATQSNLGVAYGVLAGVRDKEPNLEKSIKAFEEALTIYTKKDYPINYADIQNNLGNAYEILAGVRDKEPNLEKSIKAFEEALTIYTKKDYPIDYAVVQGNLKRTLASK
jgi:tetratricopeptide (TPR) repeat protein